MALLSATNLPPQHANSFNSVLKFYEQRQFKKALKIAETILKSNPTHGETLAMKGLLLKSLERSDEGFAIVHEGLRHAISSALCWNVLGIMYSKDLDHGNAYKSFARAAKLEPGNLSVLRELSTLQTHFRDYKGLLDTRLKILQSKPSFRPYWLAFALANHLNKNYDVAIKALDNFLETVVKEPLDSPAELSECILYKVYVLKEANEHARIVSTLDENKKHILDLLSFHEERADALLKLNRANEAKRDCYALLDLNCENHEYLFRLQAVRGLPFKAGLNVDNMHELEMNREQEKHILDLYDSLIAKYPNSQSAKLLALGYARDAAEFAKRLEQFVKPYIKKTIPSLFSVLKSFYRDQPRVQIIEKLFLDFEKNLNETGKFSPEDKEQEAPCAVLWVYIFLAYHFDLTGDLTRAMQYIGRAIEHTPTVVELYLCKARIFKHCGDDQEAAQCLQLARNMDLADRYLNTRTGKYLLRANQCEEAEKILGIFAKNPGSQQLPIDEQKFNLRDMQGMWFELESGDAHFRRGEYGRALKEFLCVVKHFEEIHDDQYDFHNYCLRKMVLRAYVDMLRFEDKLKSHKYYFKAAKGLITTYIKLFDTPASEIPPKVAEKAGESVGKKYDPRRADVDPNGDKLVHGVDFLAEATKYLNAMEQFSSDKIETHLLGVEVYLRKKSYGQAAEAVKQAQKLEPHNPLVHKGIVQLLFQFDQESSSVDPAQKQLVERAQLEWLGVQSVLSGPDLISALTQYNQKFKSSVSDHSLLHGSTVAELDFILTKKTSAFEPIESALKNSSNARVTIRQVNQAFQMLQRVFKDEQILTQFKSLVQSRFPLSKLQV